MKPKESWRNAFILAAIDALTGCAPDAPDTPAFEYRSSAFTTGKYFDDGRLPHHWNKHGSPIDPGIPPGNGSSNNFYCYSATRTT
jgi:hypothetical protein